MDVDPSMLRDGSGNTEWASEASRMASDMGNRDRVTGENCSLICSSASNPSFNVHVTQALWQPGSCDELGTDGYV